MTTLKVSGTRERARGSAEIGRGLPPGKVVVKDAARVHANRAGAPPLTLEGLQPDDVIEIELQDGLRIWTRVDDAPRNLMPRAGRGQASGGIDIPTELAFGPASRSGGGWAVKALKVIGLDIEEEITGFVADHVEGQLQPGPGLYRLSPDDPTRLGPAGSLHDTGPILIFLHGTASSTAGSFAGLWTGKTIGALFDFYRGRVFGYQHRTLTESPIENAVALVRDLVAAAGTNREVHIVSHSRGGLIGELLARGMRVGAAPFTPDDFALFEGDGRTRDREALEALGTALQTARLQITRFVRVACPARGTTLADRRLDRYVSVLVNLASLVPGLQGNPVYDGLTNLLAGVLKKRTDPEELPGLEAMMPTSPLVRMLNDPDVRTSADLHVLGGDLAGTGVFGRLKTLVTDFYYRDDHDVVVNTPAMLGGIERTTPVRYWIDTGDQVTHFHYFSRSDTARRLSAALTGPDTDFHTLEARPSAVTSADYRKRATLSKPVVFVLPGIMGSQLTLDEHPVWMNIAELARGGLSRLSASDGVKATGLLSNGYAALCLHLAATHDVMPFPYDWRRPLDELAETLRLELDAALPRAEAAKQPIRLLAHSMGGLVVRAMLATPEGRRTWERMCVHPGARFVMLGTPNGGSFAIPAMLMGRDALVKKLALVDLRSKHAELLSTIAAFDGVLNLLPHTGGMDFFDPSAWERLLDRDAPETRGLFGSSVETSKSAGFRWTVPDEAALRRAKRLAEVVAGSPLDPARVVYVAGAADETAADIVIDDEAPAGRRVRVMASSRGDGRVLWETGIPKGIRAFYMDTMHGDLANDRRHFVAIAELLDSGTTARLPTSPPARRDENKTFEMREPMAAMVPDEAEIVAAALGGQREPFTTTEDTHIALRVVHDNLTNARFPVLVSHYRHDVIVGAEKYLDQRLDWRLSELLRMELYPGPINTGVVVLNDTQGGNLAVHPGAIVAGLGVVGELTPGTLTSTLAHALTQYGADCVGRARRRQQREGSVSGSIVRAPVTAILIGSGEGGLSLSDSIRALLRSIQQANLRLRGGALRENDDDRERLIAQIDQVEIFELYEDRAIEAVHVLRAITAAPEFEAFAVDPLLVDGDEGQRRARFEQASGWWQRLRVIGEDDGTLKFEAVTQIARAPMSLTAGQRGLVDRFVEKALETTSDDPRLGQTLFELLVPNDFKSYAPERRKLALTLNPAAAAIPWELMRDGFDRSSEPLSVSTGMIRQLRVESERLQVLRAPSSTALVVGNPMVSDDRFPPLAGAAAEATAVAALLAERNYDVQLLLEEAADPMSVLTAVHERPWRILHLAAHGVFEFEPESGDGRLVSGLVMDDGVFFTAAEADQLRHVPELVFINCCHLGQSRGDASPHVAFHRLAANLATQFIKMGARAVVAAGWAVDDAAAKTFATAFYREMLDGQLYGDAVKTARSETYSRHGSTNTWGAYQCYGDPSFSLLTGQAAPAESAFVSPNELSVWLEAQARDARRRGAADQLVAALEQREASTPASWWNSASLCAKAADAFSQAGEFERAIGYYEKVVNAERATAPIAALEQLANCRVRLAGQLLRRDPPDSERARALLRQAEDSLRQLLAIGATSERYALLGGTLKRRAQLPGIKAESRRKSLSGMLKAYKSAFELSRDRGEPTAYALANQVAAAVVLGWDGNPDGQDAGEVDELLAELRRQAEALSATRTDAFLLSAAADSALLDVLAARTADEEDWRRVHDAFAQVLSRGAAPRARESMSSQLQFLRSMVEAELSKDDGEALAERLELLERSIA